ncbi:MAG: DNA-protecting protein DprA, partial [Chryseobacterium sp.]
MSIIHQIGLSLVKNVGHITARNLLSAFGSAEAIFQSSVSELVTVPGVGLGIAKEIRSTGALQEAERNLEQLQKKQITPLFYTDVGFPRRLRECYDAPILLYYKGNADLNVSKVVSIVGTRKASAYGRLLCKQLIETLQRHQVLVVSGLAFGIDVSAHQESLNF